MKKTVPVIARLLLHSILLVSLASWSNGEPTVEGASNKQRINFYGTLLTHQGKITTKIDNISIGGKYKQIPMFEKPSLKKPASTHSKQEIPLEADPKTELVTTKIDLSEVSQILVPQPHTLWFYKKEKGYRRSEYLEVVVVSNNQQKTKAHYLLEAKTKIYCAEVNPAGPIEKEVPLAAINTLTISGYKFRVLPSDNGSQNVACKYAKTVASAKKDDLVTD